MTNDEGRSHRSVGRTVVRSVGELLVTLGLVLLLLVVYELFVTDLFGNRKQAAATEVLDERWAAAGTAEVMVSAPPVGTTAGSSAGSSGGSSAGSSGASRASQAPGAVPNPSRQQTDPAKRTKKYSTELGQGFAKLYIPTFGADFARTVIEGTSVDDLYTGPGHYSDSQFPGQPGNFAIAGHRVTKGAPFNDLDLLKSCDALVVETQDDWFIYRMLPTQEKVANWNPAKHPHCQGVSAQTGAYAGVFGRTIVQPEDGNEVFGVPGSSSSALPARAERLITLTTCHPQFSDAQRMVIHGVLVRSYAKAAGFLPPELGES
jgi:sortase A